MDSGELTLKKLTWHGLSTNEPLIFEHAIRSCFENPDRKNFPDFPKNLLRESLKLKDEDHDPEWFIQKASPQMVNKFNNMRIRLNCTYSMYNNPDINKEKYSETMKNCRWYGPYEIDYGDVYFFFTIVGTGDNQYFATLSLDMISPTFQSITLFT